MSQPRVMINAGASGSGKTLITCGLLQALLDRGMETVSFKCGPDFIDPMFHRTVIGAKSRNLDTYFTDDETTRWLYKKNAEGADISVMEGVMGFYDGLGGMDTKASSYDLARATQTPVILIVNCKGMSLSVVPFIKGFLEYKKDSNIRGVILNRMSPMIYTGIAKIIREELGIEVFGYVPDVKELQLESRHLGLVLPEEIPELKNNLRILAQKLEETLDIDGIIRLAQTAPQIEAPQPQLPQIEAPQPQLPQPQAIPQPNAPAPTIAVARDEAFCFLYDDNLELLERAGAKLVYFSPIHDGEVPAEADGLLLPGGYPELHLGALSANTSMLASIRTRIEAGIPCIAECGGFMYLMDTMEDMDHKEWKTAGVIHGRAFRTKRLNRFGYAEYEPQKEQMLGADLGPVKGHEFHYFDTTMNGDTFLATKGYSRRTYECVVGTPNLVAGYPHLYYWSNPEAAVRFVQSCANYAASEKM